MTHIWFSNFHCAYINIQVVHTEFIEVVHTHDSASKSSRKMTQKKAAAALTIALTSEKNRSRKNKKRKVCVKPWLEKKKKRRVL